MFPSFLNAKSHVERCLLPRKPSIMTASPQKAATDALRRGIDSSGNAAPLALPLHLNTLCKTLARITLLQSAPQQRKEGTVLLLSKSVALSSRLPCEWNRPLLRPRGSLDCNSMCANREKQCVLWPEERNVLPKLKRAAVILEETKRGRRRKGKIKREEGEGGGKSEEKWGKKKKRKKKEGGGEKKKKRGKKRKGKKKKAFRSRSRNPAAEEAWEATRSPRAVGARVRGPAWPAAGCSLRKIVRGQWQSPALRREGRDWCRGSADPRGSLTGTEWRGMLGRRGGNGPSLPQNGAMCEEKVYQ